GIRFFCSAFATAESSTFVSVRLGPSGVSCSTRRASSTCRPRMRSTDRRIFRGEIRMYLAEALASICVALLERGAPFGVVPVGAEGPGQRELPQLVPDHGFGDEHRDVLAAVVHGDGVSHHLRNDGRAAGPGLDDPLLPATVHINNLLHKIVIDERPLLDRTQHRLSPSLPTPANTELVPRLGPASPAFLFA